MDSLANSSWGGIPHLALKFCLENFDFLREVLTPIPSISVQSPVCWYRGGALKKISVKSVCKKVSSYMAYSSLV